MDTLPNLSRDLVITPRMAHQEDNIPALFIGGSNADKLANAAASLGVVADTITEGGWILSTSSVSIILPQVEAYCATLPPDAPVVIYCLDNSSFCCADQDGTLASISKDKSDNKYHVVGELVVVHEITMAAAVTNLKRLLAICGDRKHSLPAVRKRIMLLYNGPLCAPPDSGLRPQTTGGSEASPLLLQTAPQFLCQLHGYPGRRPDCREEGRQQLRHHRRLLWVGGGTRLWDLLH
jgi:hypothetical protein